MQTQKFRIGNRLVGEDEPCFIIAEAGSNHDGKLSQAKELIDVATESGADAVKFQLFLADEMAAKTDHPIVKIDIAGCKTLHELYKSLELPWHWLGELASYAKNRGIIFLCTPFHEKAVDELDRLGVPAFKIASFEIVHLPLLRYVASRGKPIILSTGMANLGEIEEAIFTIIRENNKQLILLHCGIGYPHKLGDVNLAAMDTMKEAFGFPVGYSDHTLGITIPVAAVARGARVIEKHFTINRRLSGPDHHFALEPSELKDMVKAIRDTEWAIGSRRKSVAESELVRYNRGRRSIFARVDISQGTRIAPEMLSILRPGIGLMPKYFDVVVGRTARTNIKTGQPITWSDI